MTIDELIEYDDAIYTDMFRQLQDEIVRLRSDIQGYEWRVETWKRRAKRAETQLKEKGNDA